MTRENRWFPCTFLAMLVTASLLGPTRPAAGDAPPALVPGGGCFDKTNLLAPLTGDLSSNRGDILPDGRIQLTAFYDGSGAATLAMELEAIDGSGERFAIEFDIVPFSERIVTREYDAFGLAPTGYVEISGVQPNGVIDGVAFGGIWRDEGGFFRSIQSYDKNPSRDASFVGTWPLYLSEADFLEKTPQITDGEGRNQARAMLFGAKLIDNGCYRLKRGVD